MQKGTIKFFNESRGFGFITLQSSENEIFVHISGLIDKVRENDEVVFDVVQGPKGLSAVKVKIA
ncbi:cold-shock protein [Olivibacter domesticus]|uniref:Cold shock protein (Beta-ribbon, CspA family) n=1 Tax=Olivibacter domesticus TaxID=407022 RepID=A0A1H7JBM6_OLID1|nr:cold shock domain-containing protein [Olivibacter domesticus]SEK72101.1 cold shock protein (beta-ribbon, CspA family) [Olivibacter domesticus]